MTLSPGTRLGPFEILAPIGTGGMGEVYRAHDSRLGRDVAIKVLSPHLTASPEARARFEREARTISQLNHPHICTLHDIGREGDADYLVMELLEGETLAHRLDRGPLPTAEVLALGAQIADALDRAHRAGVVHRDLKPGNVMLTKAGAKLMDFGLARAHAPGPVAGAQTESPTVTRPLTAEGTIVGTFQYMAPEQLEGKEADARSDIWALGCVLYEMATGKRAFEGQSQASLIAAIMDHEPRAILELQPLSPPPLERAVKRCLMKDPDDRWQSARDAMHELQWIAAGSQAGAPAPVPLGQRRRGKLSWGAAVAAMAIAIVALAAVVALLLIRRPPAPGLVRLSINPPEGGDIVLGPHAALSPDGRRVAFVVVDSAGTQRLWVRPLDSSASQPLAGTEGAFLPFWSPDSRSIAFFAGGKLKKVLAGGGPLETICDAPNPRGGTWNKDGVIVFAPMPIGSLSRVSSEGGEVVTVASPDSAQGETALRFPCFLPDGRHFVYVSLPKKQGLFNVYVGSLDSKDVHRVMRAESAPVYAEPGYLLFERGGRLVAQRFDRSKMRPVGEALPLADVPPVPVTEAAPLLCPPGRDGLVYVSAKIQNTQLTWLDRAGRPTGVVPLPPGCYRFPSLSPDGRRAAVAKLSTATLADLAVVDLERAVSSRLTFDGAMAAYSGPSLWSPDGGRIAFVYKPAGSWDIYQVSAAGTGRPEPLVVSSVFFKWPVAWSPDGEYVIYAQEVVEPGQELWLLPLTGERKPVLYLRSPFNVAEYAADLSPDGRWLACSSDESGRNEVYVYSFPVAIERYQVSTSGATAAQWSRDGRELLLIGEVNTPGVVPPSAPESSSGVVPIYAVDVQTTPRFKPGAPRLLFTLRRDRAEMSAARDLQRFLVAVPVEGASPASITVILNWQETLKR